MYKNAITSSILSSADYKHLKHKNLNSDLTATCLSSSITIDFTERSENQTPTAAKISINEGERSAGYSVDESVFNYSFGTTEGSCENLGRPMRALSTCSNTETVDCCHHSDKSDSANYLEIAGKKITYCTYEHVISYTPETLLKRYQEICTLTSVNQTPAKVGVSFLDIENDPKCLNDNIDLPEHRSFNDRYHTGKDSSGTKSRTTRVFRNFLALVSPSAERRSRSKDTSSGTRSQPRSKSAAAESYREKRRGRNEMSKKNKRKNWIQMTQEEVTI